MDRQRITYGPFGFRWGFAAIALGTGVMAVGMVYLRQDMRLGSALRCDRTAAAPKHRRPSGFDGRFIRCTSRRGSRSNTFTLEGVRGARIGKTHRSETYNVYLTYADGSNQRVLPSGQAVQHRFGPTDKATALETARQIELFLHDPSQRYLELTLEEPTRTLVFMLVGTALLGLLCLYTLFHALRSFCRFTIERGMGPGALTVHRTLWILSLGTRTLRVADATRVAVERRGLDRLLEALDIQAAQGRHLVLYDDATDVPLAYVTRAGYPGTRPHEEAADALRRLLHLET